MFVLPVGGFGHDMLHFVVGGKKRAEWLTCYS